MINDSTASSRLPNWVWVLGAIVIVAAVAIGILLGLQKSSDSDKNTTNLAVTPSLNTPEHATPIYSYVGTIIAIKDDRITLNVLARNNDLPNDLIVSVIVDDSTSINKLSTPKTIPQNATQDELRQLFTRWPISFEQLSIEDALTVVSSGNIRNQEVFTASRIDLRVVE